jgi:crotonobetainyl-CoA:carnitine CoA-transferase CaiB-like acyl-CoA transferase
MAFEQGSFEPEAKGPLSGIRIIDLSRLITGNLLTHVLSDMGADVIKVEPPAGDMLRSMQANGISTYWKQYSRNKKSLCLELRKPEARDILLRLLPSATVFIEGFRPGTLEKMGLSPTTLLERQPKLIVARISGWGQDGPYRERPGFGTLIEGASGFASMNGFPDREPVLPPFYLADTMAGLYGAIGVMLALREVEVNGGRGQVLDLPLLDPLFSVLGPHAADYRLTGKVRQRTGSRTSMAPRNTYRTKDGKWLCLSAVQKMAERLFRAIGRPDLTEDPRFNTNSSRVENVEALDEIVGKFVGERTLADNLEFFERAEITAGSINDISQLIDDPHVLARKLIVDYPDQEMGQFPMHGVLPRLLGTPGSIRTPAPRLGEHNRALLEEVGIDAEAYAKLVASGAVVEGTAEVKEDEG